MFRFTKYAVQVTFHTYQYPEHEYLVFVQLDTKYGTTFADIPKIIGIRHGAKPEEVRIVSAEIVLESDTLD